MKKLFVLALCAAAFVSLESCKSKKVETAASVVTEQAKLLKEGNYDMIVDKFYVVEEPNATPEVVTARKTAVKHGLRTRVQPRIQSKGGLKDTKVVSENVSNDGKQATVVVNHEYNNGEKETATYQLAKVNDKWHMRGDHMRDVWRSKDSNGQETVIKLLENDNRDVLKENIDGEPREFAKEIEEGRRDVEKVRDADGREIEKVIEHRDGTTVTKEKADGQRTVTKVKEVK